MTNLDTIILTSLSCAVIVAALFLAYFLGETHVTGIVGLVLDL